MTSVFFDNFSHHGQQTLVEDLCIEAISIYGHSIYYLPRKLNAKDDIYGEDTISTYDNAYEIDGYIKSFDSFEGDGTFLSKFNMQIRDSITFSIARRTFNNEIGTQSGLIRPREGDLIYSKMLKRIFVIGFVDDKPVFYQLGALQFYNIKCDVWEYSSERFNTGIQEIDELEDKYTTSQQHFISPDTIDFDEQNQDVFADNLEFDEEAVGVVDFSENNPFYDIL
jgi:hypothetical protein